MTEEQLAKLRQLRKKELQAIIASPRASGVVIIVEEDSCQAARLMQGTYPKDASLVPELPLDSCSKPGECRCRYEPFIVEVGP